jgi:hypothetical protein
MFQFLRRTVSFANTLSCNAEWTIIKMVYFIVSIVTGFRFVCGLSVADAKEFPYSGRDPTKIKPIAG